MNDPASATETDLRRDRTGTWFADDRGIDRRLKVSWHPERKLLVLSLWQGDTCTATFRLGVAEVPRLVRTLVDALGQAATRVATSAGSPAPGASLAGARERLARWRTDRRR